MCAATFGRLTMEDDLGEDGGGEVELLMEVTPEDTDPGEGFLGTKSKVVWLRWGWKYELCDRMLLLPWSSWEWDISA